MGGQQKRSVLIFIDALEAGGAQKQALLLAKLLVESHDVTVIVYYGKKAHYRMEQMVASYSGNIVRLKGNHLFKIAKLFRLFREKRHSVLLTYILLPNFLGGLLGRIAGVRVIIGGIRNSYLIPWKEVIERVLQNYITNHTVYNCYSGQSLLEKRGFNQKKSTVIPNCYLQTTPLRKKANTGTPLILSVGRFTAQKDYYTSLLAMRELHKAGILFRYRIVGWGPVEAQVRQWIEELDLRSHIDILVDPPDVFGLFSESDIFLLTSIFEGLPNAVMEAMDNGLPVVATKVGDCDRLVVENLTGFLVTPRDYCTVFNRLKLLIQDQELRTRMGNNGWNKLHGEYNREVFVNRYTDLFKSLKVYE